MSTPASPPPADPVPPPPAVPYRSADEPATATTPFSAPITTERVAKGVGSTALKWGIRIAIPIILRALFRGLARR